MSLYIFGIRHHGPGSSRSLQRALEVLKPDCVLIEGPPDADGILSFVSSDQMRPPVAILVYNTDTPSRAVYYPFAAFSPEWAAMQYGIARGLPVRFMDLPQTHQLLEMDNVVAHGHAPSHETETPELDLSSIPSPTKPPIHTDPLGWLACSRNISLALECWIGFWGHVETRVESLRRTG